MNKKITPAIILSFLFLYSSLLISAEDKPKDKNENKKEHQTLRQVTDEKEFQEILTKLEDHRKTISDLTADFTQVKTVMPFEDKEKATGSFSYKSPNKVMWEFFTPEKNKVLVKDNRGYVILDELKQVQVFSLENNNRFNFLLAGLGKPLSSFFNDFRVLCFKGENSGKQIYSFLLTPKDKNLSTVLKQFEIKIDAETLIPTSTELIENSGDITVMNFSGIKLNPKIKEQFFEYKIPPSYEVLDYRE